MATKSVTRAGTHQTKEKSVGGTREVTHADEEDGDNVDLKNYKGIYANEDNGQKYQCPVTGAHFEIKDLCRRLTKVIEKRKPLEDEIYGTTTATAPIKTAGVAL